MHLLSATSVAGLLALQGHLTAAHGGHNTALEALHRYKHKRHHSRELQHTSRAEMSPMPAPLFTRGAQQSPSALNPRSFDDVPTREKRGTTCAFPKDAGLVAVTPDSKNGGWAIPPDTACTSGQYCPYACPSGQVMAQWDPSATSYNYPASMNGGLKCNSDGTVSKPFSDKPYCVDASGIINAKDKTGKGCAFCQTQLPGDESMVIPTNVQGTTDIAIPGPDYWAHTAAHYYINPPGVSTSDGCQWGSSAKPHGNWAPYVAGGNTDNDGQTFIKMGWNPIYLEPATPFRDTMPDWGVEIVCGGEGCQGLPCAIDPSKNKVNEMVGGQATGAGGANFCVVTVPKGVKASFVVFSGSSNSPGALSASSAAASHPSSSSSEPASSSPPPSSSSSSSSPAPTTSSSLSSSSSSSSSPLTTSHSSSSSYSTPSPSYTYAPHQMLVNITNSTSSSSKGTGSSVVLPTGASNSNSNSGSAGGAGSSTTSQTSSIASAKTTGGAASTGVVHGGLVAAVAFAAIAVF